MHFRHGQSTKRIKISKFYTEFRPFIMGLKFTTFEIEIQDEFRFRLINKPYGIENDPFSV